VLEHLPRLHYIRYINIVQFVASWYIGLPNLSLQDRHFLESLWFGIDGHLLCFYLFLPKKSFQQKILTLIMDSAASSRGQGQLTYCTYFPWLPIEAWLSNSKFCFLLTRGRKLQFLSFARCLGSADLEITQHQALVSTIFNVIWNERHFTVSTCELLTRVQLVILNVSSFIVLIPYSIFCFLSSASYFSSP
jgi:hypothetical protein